MYMEQVAFKMVLKKGCEEEYKKRHNAIWPDLKKLLKDSGISDYSVFWDEETNILFAVQKNNGKNSQQLSNYDIVKKWWDYMSDIMETNHNKSPISKALPLLFRME